MASVLLANKPILLIDEPSKGLSPKFVQQLVEVIRTIRQSTTILLVEQNFYLASQVADRFHVIDDGRTVLAGTMAELAASEALQRRYLGLYKAEGDG